MSVVRTITSGANKITLLGQQMQDFFKNKNADFPFFIHLRSRFPAESFSRKALVLIHMAW